MVKALGKDLFFYFSLPRAMAKALGKDQRNFEIFFLFLYFHQDKRQIYIYNIT